MKSIIGLIAIVVSFGAMGDDIPEVWGANELYLSIAATQKNLKTKLGDKTFKELQKLDFQSRLNTQKNGAVIVVKYTKDNIKVTDRYVCHVGDHDHGDHHGLVFDDEEDEHEDEIHCDARK